MFQCHRTRHWSRLFALTVTTRGIMGILDDAMVSLTGEGDTILAGSEFKTAVVIGTNFPMAGAFWESRDCDTLRSPAVSFFASSTGVDATVSVARAWGHRNESWLLELVVLAGFTEVDTVLEGGRPPSTTVVSGTATIPSRSALDSGIVFSVESFGVVELGSSVTDREPSLEL